MKLVASLVLVLSSAQALATQSADGWSFGGDISHINLDEDIAKRQGVSNSAWLVGIDANYFKNDWMTTVGMQVIGYSDNNEFKQRVENDGLFNHGDISTESSDANAIILNAAFGKLWRVSNEHEITLTSQLGYSAVVSSERSISFCDNCYSEDIDVDGGFYVRVGAQKHFSGVALGLAFSQYLANDGLKNSIGITLHSSF